MAQRKNATDASSVRHNLARKRWVRPVVRVMEAGSAENGFSQQKNDGQFTSS